MPRSPCPPTKTRDVKTKECRDKMKPGRKQKVTQKAPTPKPSTPKVTSKYTEEYLKNLPYPKLVEIHKKMEESGKIMMRKGMKRDAAHLVERILRKQ